MRSHTSWIDHSFMEGFQLQPRGRNNPSQKDTYLERCPRNGAKTKPFQGWVMSGTNLKAPIHTLYWTCSMTRNLLLMIKYKPKRPVNLVSLVRYKMSTKIVNTACLFLRVPQEGAACRNPYHSTRQQNEP